MSGFHIAADCMVQADRGASTGERQMYVTVVRERCDLGRDRAFAVALNELEHRADAGELGTTASLLNFVEELKQDVPDTSDARALLDGLEAGAQVYGEMYERTNTKRCFSRG
jgi:hypothetical protein